MKTEIDFMFQYIAGREEEGGLNITELLDETAQLLDRDYRSVNYKYYSLLNKINQKQDTEQSAIQFSAISQPALPIDTTEIINDFPTVPNMNQQNDVDDDLLDILSGLINNVQKLPRIHLNELLRCLFELTNMALQNQDAVQQLEAVKSETNNEKEALQKNTETGTAIAEGKKAK